MEDKKAYLVITGQRPDDVVEAVFTTRERAQAYIDSYGQYGIYDKQFDIAEVDLDPECAIEALTLYAFHVQIDRSTLSTRFVDAAKHYEPMANEGRMSYSQLPDTYDLYLWAASGYHAECLAKELGTKINEHFPTERP